MKPKPNHIAKRVIVNHQYVWAVLQTRSYSTGKELKKPAVAATSNSKAEAERFASFLG